MKWGAAVVRFAFLVLVGTVAAVLFLGSRGRVDR